VFVIGLFAATNENKQMQPNTALVGLISIVVFRVLIIGLCWWFGLSTISKLIRL